MQLPQLLLQQVLTRTGSLIIVPPELNQERNI
jgi:hypothetical protein